MPGNIKYDRKQKIHFSGEKTNKKPSKERW